MIQGYPDSNPKAPGPKPPTSREKSPTSNDLVNLYKSHGSSQQGGGEVDKHHSLGCFPIYIYSKGVMFERLKEA